MNKHKDIINQNKRLKRDNAKVKKYDKTERRRKIEDERNKFDGDEGYKK